MKTNFSSKQKRLSLGLLTLVVVALVLVIQKQKTAPYQHNSGFVFGTTYNIAYQSKQDLQSDIERELKKVDCALSPFNPNSVITKVNNNQSAVLDSMFIEVFTLAQNVSKDTDGAFDITVAPLVNAWGFGFKSGTMPSKSQIDSLKAFVGYEKVQLKGEGKSAFVQKTDKRTMLDCSAIAKGYGVDVVAKLLKSRGIANFMVEIGGEIVTSGLSDKRVPWRIGVAKPVDDSLNVVRENQAILNVTDKAMATSGNYRNFYYKNGKKYAHTVDPKTGRPVQHSILSATVLAPTCALADAYATSFMVMGMEKAQEVLKRHKELMAFLIYADHKGQNKVWCSPSLKDKIVE